jgi:hypothetical protein
MDERGVLDDGGSSERDPEKEPQRRHGLITNWRAGAAHSKMQLKAPDVLEARLVWRLSEESRKVRTPRCATVWAVPPAYRASGLVL